MKVRIGLETADLKKQIAEGGEARIYKYGNDHVAKVYRLPTDPEFCGEENQINAARIRIVVAQRKLPLFPRDLPPCVVSPVQMVKAESNDFIIGYTMPFIKGAKPIGDFKSGDSRTNGKATDESIMSVFRSLYDAMKALHQRLIVIGDFNDSNVLVKEKEAFIIDADSMQFGPFRSKVFIPAFVDPNRCDPNDQTLNLIKLYNEESDWYAFWVMLFQSLLFIHPYGGVYKPKDAKQKVQAAIRGLPQYRISVFNPDVIYPKQARPLDSIPAILNNFFHVVFEKGLRPIPPESLFDGMRYGKDGNFDCAKSRLNVVAQVDTSQNRIVNAKLIYETAGAIVAAECYDSQLEWLEFKDGVLYRGQTTIGEMDSINNVLASFSKDQNIIAQNGTAVVLSDNWKTGVKIALKNGINASEQMIKGSNQGSVFWDGTFKMLVGRKDPFIKILDIDPLVIPINFWVAGELLFVLCSRNKELGIVLHHLSWDTTLFQSSHSYFTPEEISDCHGYIGQNLVWLFIHARNQVTVDIFGKKGELINRAESGKSAIEAEKWMQQIHGKTAIGDFLFSMQDDGMIRIGVENTSLKIVKYAFASGDWRNRHLLIPSDRGIYMVTQQKILLLQSGIK